MIGSLILGFVGEEVVDAVQSFLSSGFILKEINFNFCKLHICSTKKQKQKEVVRAIRVVYL